MNRCKHFFNDKFLMQRIDIVDNAPSLRYVVHLRIEQLRRAEAANASRIRRG